MMKAIYFSLFFLLAQSAHAVSDNAPATAGSDGKPLTAQQSRMAQCNKEAAGSGQDRKAFMKECLSNKPAQASVKPVSAAQQAQRDRMRTCNAEAAKNGSDRKAFMKECLSRK